MPLPRRRLARPPRNDVLLVLSGGLSQGVAVIAGYVTDLDARVVAVLALVGLTCIVALSTGAPSLAKKILHLPNLLPGTY